MTGSGGNASLLDLTRGRGLRILGFVVIGGLLVAGHAWIIGIEQLRQSLAGTHPRRLASLLFVGIVPLLFWGIGLHLVFSRLADTKRPIRTVLLMFAAGFLNTITPFGQLGGDPPAAVLSKRALGTDFETGLAAISTTNAVNRLASLFLALISVGYLGSRLAIGPALERAALVVVATTAVVLVGAGLAWRARDTIIARASNGLARAARPFGRLPYVTSPSREAIESRGLRFIDAVARVASAPERLAVVFCMGVAGQLAVASALWVALAAVGVDSSIAVVLLVIPVAKLSGVIPTPGGIGGAEALLTALIVATTGVTPATAGAAALLYRASAFWVPSIGGAVATAWCVTREAGSVDTDSGPRVTLIPSQEADIAPVDRELSVTMVLLAAAVALALVSVVVIHRRRLLFEPRSHFVHTIRDAVLVVLSFSGAWIGCRHIFTYWSH